jgi:hypothetical protein
MLAALKALRKDSDLYIGDKAIEIRNDERERADGRGNTKRNNVRILQNTRLYLKRHPVLEAGP